MSFPRPLIFLSLIALVGGCVATTPTTTDTATTTTNPTTAERNPDLLPVRCLDEADLSACPGDAVGYFYDYRDNSCKPFTYGDCRVKVPFSNEQECLQVCGASR